MSVTVKSGTVLLPNIGDTPKEEHPFVDKGDLVEIGERKTVDGVDWAKVKSINSGAEGWLRATALDEAFEPKIVEIISRESFANECLLAARTVGSRTHFLLAWAEMRTGISSKPPKVGTMDVFGPYALTKAIWNKHRMKDVHELFFTETDMFVAPKHAFVAASIARTAWEGLKAGLDGRDPSGAELLLGCSIGGQTAAAALKGNKDAPIKDIVLNSLKGAPDAEQQTTDIMALSKTLLMDGDASRTLEGALKEISTKLTEALTATAPLIDKLPDDEFPLLPDDPVAASRDPDSDVVMQYCEPTTVKGHLVTIMQRALGGIAVDSTFARTTRDALNNWLTANNFPANGAITFTQWKLLTKQATAPSVYDLCAQVTAAFEGHGFADKMAGNVDSGLVTWGYLGFTWSNRHIQNILKAVDQADPSLLDKAFGGAKAAALRAALAKDLDRQIDFAKEQILGGGNNVDAAWLAGFQRLGAEPTVQAAQIKYGHDEFWTRSEKSRMNFGLSERLSAALCFDTHIQRGSFPDGSKATVEAIKNQAELEKRKALAAFIVKHTSKFKEDIRKRKECLSDGSGTVHDATYDLKFWGLMPEVDETEDHMAGEAKEFADKLDQGKVVLAGDKSFSDFFFKNLGSKVTSFLPAEFLTMGGSNEKLKLNKPPSDSLWPNVINLALVLQRFKDDFAPNHAVKICSAFRSKEYNAKVGGKKRSQHMQFKAADIVVIGKGSPSEWATNLRAAQKKLGFPGGIGRYSTFAHVDVRGFFADWKG